MTYSIDQNCHSLWDALPKVQALARAGHDVRHFIEDIDVAFTSLGSSPGGALRLARERYHHSGGADWGAALFYSEFLGRLPVEVRDFEPLTGMKTKALARQLGRTVKDLFDEFSPGDNWQLIGPSYVGSPDRHRVVADLTVAETAPFLRQVVELAESDLVERFPEDAPRGRLAEWFERERRLLEDLLARHAGGRLVELYRDWMAHYLGDSVRLDVTSSLLSIERLDPCLLEAFLTDYDRAAGLYNQAVEQTATRLRPLETTKGELPFFAVYEHDGRAVRSGVFLAGDELRVAERSFPLAAGRRLPLERLRAAGVTCLSGKAALLTLQVRSGRTGRSLALPYRGSAYMPAAHRLAELLRGAGLLAGTLHPVLRVRFRLLDRMRTLETIIRLPEHLADAMGRDEVPASVLGRNHADLVRQAETRLAALADPSRRGQWQRDNLPDLARQADDLDRRRRELARTDPKSQEIRDLWKQAKTVQTEMLRATLRRVARDVQVGDLDYWDSRGALLPWCVALGGEAFYNQVIAGAEIYPEPAQG